MSSDSKTRGQDEQNELLLTSVASILRAQCWFEVFPLYSCLAPKNREHAPGSKPVVVAGDYHTPLERAFHEHSNGRFLESLSSKLTEI